MDELHRGNELMAELVRNQKDWRIAFRNGLLAGLGGVIGATVLVSTLVWIMKPLQRLEVFKPTLERIAQELERRPRK